MNFDLKKYSVEQLLQIQKISKSRQLQLLINVELMQRPEYTKLLKQEVNSSTKEVNKEHGKSGLKK